jgi:hypothetical protein
VQTGRPSEDDPEGFRREKRAEVGGRKEEFKNLSPWKTSLHCCYGADCKKFEPKTKATNNNILYICPQQ